MRKILIGIDPDCKKSGVAIKEKGVHELNVDCFTFFELLEYLKSVRELFEDVFIYIEAGWLNKKSNYHNYINQSKQVDEIIAKKVGANHETGKKIVEMCEYLNLKYELIKPTSKKITPEYFEKLTGMKVKGEFKQDMIDAGMLIIGR